MSWKNVRLVFLREVRDQLRDRRTLFMIAVLPLLLYPALGIGMMQMRLVFREQPRLVVILGTKDLPDVPLIAKNRFHPSLFPSGAAGSVRLKVITDAPRKQNGDDPDEALRERRLKQAREIRSRIEQLEKTRNADDKQRLNRDVARLFAASGIQVLIIIPDGFAADVERVNRRFAQQDDRSADIADYKRPIIVKNSADEKSVLAYKSVQTVMKRWENKLLQRRLEEAKLPASISKPLQHRSVDLAEAKQISASLWSRLIPALLVIMAVTGAFYPAVDLAAGEKERGTMETLLISPATRGEIVIGKFLCVMSFSMATALLNLLSMGFTGKYMLSMAATGPLMKMNSLQLPEPLAVLWMVILLIPLAALFSALCLALATFARSSKEGQYYLTPLLMVTMGLTVFCVSSGVEIRPLYSVMPIVGPALLLKKLLASPTSTEALLYAIPVLITSVGYSLLALWWAVEQFSSEEVLFRESERFELGLWVRHLLRDKEPLPTFAEAGFCFIAIMFLQFAAMKFMQTAILKTDPAAQPTRMIQLLMIQQLALIASPALFMGTLLTTSVLRTFRLRLPNWKVLSVAAILPLALHPLSLELAAVMQRYFFLKLPEDLTERLATMSDPHQPLWLILLAFAAAPAICEELTFRGFILSGFGRSGRLWLAIGLSSLAFGTMHMIPQQVFNATLLGLVLGLIAVRGNSLFPCMVFHFVYNSLAVLHGRIGQLNPAWLKTAPVDRFVSIGKSGIRYPWPTLLIAGVVAIVLLRWIANWQGGRDPVPAQTAEPAENSPQTDATLEPSLPIGSRRT